MAAIDKIYGTLEQYQQFKQWCEKHNPKLLSYFYNLDTQNMNEDQEYMISNFPCWADYYLMRKCNIPFVVERLHQQHSPKYWRWLKYRQYKSIIFMWLYGYLQNISTTIWFAGRTVKSDWIGYMLWDIVDVLSSIESWFLEHS